MGSLAKIHTWTQGVTSLLGWGPGGWLLHFSDTEPMACCWARKGIHVLCSSGAMLSVFQPHRGIISVCLQCLLYFGFLVHSSCVLLCWLYQVICVCRGFDLFLPGIHSSLACSLRSFLFLKLTRVFLSCAFCFMKSWPPYQKSCTSNTNALP